MGAGIVPEDNQVINSQKICVHESHPSNHNILALYSNAIDNGHSLGLFIWSRLPETDLPPRQLYQAFI